MFSSGGYFVGIRFCRCCIGLCTTVRSISLEIYSTDNNNNNEIAQFMWHVVLWMSSQSVMSRPQWNYFILI